MSFVKIAIIGASGFIGRNLLGHLLEHTDHEIIALAPDPEHIVIKPEYKDRVQVFQCDIFNYDQMRKGFESVDIAYFLVHLMADKGGFYDREAKAADITGRALSEAGVRRVIYLSGLGSDKETLSQHLASRHNTGYILSQHVPCLIEFRASMVIAKGSISFEIVRHLDRKLPIMILPRWSSSKTQPIALPDALAYLTAAIDVPLQKHEIVEIGGLEAMSYVTFLKRYAAFLGRHPLIIRIPIVPEWMAGWWLYLVMPKNLARVGQHMVSSFRNEMVVTNNRAQELFPDIKPRAVEEAFDCCELPT
jgi:uncharacterized protein YbjT (DUF2867 family)